MKFAQMRMFPNEGFRELEIEKSKIKQFYKE